MTENLPSLPEVQPEAAKPAPEAKPVRPRGGGLALTVSLLALIVAGAAPFGMQKLMPVAAPVAAPAKDYSVEITALKAQLATLPTATTVDLAPLEARLAALESRSEVGPNAELLMKVGALESKITQLEKALKEAENGQVADRTFLVASLQISTTWSEGLPFAAPWVALVSAASQSDPTLALKLNDAAETLLPWRDSGIPTLIKLTADYADMARAAVAASRPEGESWTQQSLRRIEGLVVIRREGEAVPLEDTAADAVLARAENLLKFGQLTKAVEELEKLEGPAAKSASAWLAGARARLLVDALSADITASAAATLQPSAGGEQP